VPLPEQVLTEVRSKEAGAAGNYAGRHEADAIGANTEDAGRVLLAISEKPRLKNVQVGGEKRLRGG
jgi:hypothetical protein